MVTYRATNLISGTYDQRIALSTSNLQLNTRFFETDTQDLWAWPGGSWGLVASNTASEILQNKTINSPIINTAQIGDSNATNKYIFGVGALAADRTVTLPLLTSNDTFTMNGFGATLTNKSLDADNNTFTNISNASIKSNAAIADTKLATLSTANKVSGSAIQLAGTSAIEDSTGLRLKSAVAGGGLSLSSQVLAVNVDDSSVETNGGNLRVKASGVTNAMLAGSIAVAKLGTSETLFSVATNPTFGLYPGGTLSIDGTNNEITITGSGSGGDITITVGLPTDVTITGNLTVNGNTTTVNTATLSVEDPLIALATGNTANSVDTGFYSRYRTASTDLYTGLFWDATDSKYKLFHGNQAAPTTTVNTSGTGYMASTLVVGSLEGTLTTAAQGNITSVGTIASLITSGVLTAGGVVSITDGSNSAPALTNTGDTNTGIYFSAADTVDVTTGATRTLTISAGIIAIRNGGTVSQVRLYCETGNAHYVALQSAPHSSYSGNATLTMPASTDTLVGRATTDTLINKTLTSPVLTTPQINDSAANHQYVFGVADLAADRTVSLPLLTGNDTFTFNAFAATLTNKTIDSDSNTITNIVNADIKASAAIVDTKLATISTGNKVSGSAVQLAGTSALENSSGLRVKSALAGDGLALSSQVLAVNVDDSSIETNSDALRVKAAGITNAMLAGSIVNGKLSGPSIAVTDGSTSSNIAPGGTLTFTATTNETTVAQSGGTVTIGMPDNVTIGGNLIVTGNSTVNGTTTTVNSTIVTVDDPVFTIGGDTAPGSADAKDRGIEFRYFLSGDQARIGFFGFDNSGQGFTGFTSATNSSEVFSGTVMNATFGNIAGTLTTAAQAGITSVGTLASLIVTGAGVFNGNVDLGNATSDTITATGRFDSDLVPSSDDARDLGTSLLEWQDLYLDGTANIDILTADAGTVGGVDIVTLSATQTLTAKTLTAPKFSDGGFIADAAGLQLIIFDSVSSAVNEITVANAATGVAPSIKSSGETNIGLIISGNGTGGVILTNSTVNGAFLEFDVKVASSTFGSQGAETARLYLKQVDTNNNALAVKIQKAGAMVEVEITSPRAVCAECGSRDGAKDPLYDFERGVMVLDLWCGHSFEVPMQWSQINGN